MAITIDKASLKTFEDNVRHKAQQEESALRRWVQEKNKTTSEHSFKITGTRALSEAPKTRRQATPVNDQEWANRVAIPASYDDGEIVDHEDIAKMIIDPMSAITTSMSYAVNRKYDALLINALDANALDEAQAVNVFPAGQYWGDYSEEISLKAVTQIAKKFAVNEVPDAVEKVAVIGPNQAEKLLHDPKATNADYVNAKQLVEGGFVKRWMGFSWIRSNLLITPAPEQIKCAFFTRAAMGLLVIEDLFTRVGERPDLSYAMQAYIRIHAGAVRVQDEQIVMAKFKDTVTYPA